jgi:hypothetical protein
VVTNLARRWRGSFFFAFSGAYPRIRIANRDRFAGQPDLIVVRVALPMPSMGDASQLSGWTFEWKPSEPQPADGAISFVVPTAARPIQFTLRPAENPATAVSGILPVPKVAAHKPSTPLNFESAVLCFKSDLCLVTGRFNGDSLNTFVAFDSIPARIVTETDIATYIEVPAFMNLGPAALIVAEGTKVASMMIVVAELTLAPGHGPTEAGKDTGPTWWWMVSPN